MALSGLTWGEGIRVRGAAVWLSDPQGGTLLTNAAGEWVSHPLTSQSNGLWMRPDGSILGSMMAQRRVGIWDGERFAAYADLSGVARGPLGDMVGDEAGGLYVDDVGYSAHLGEPPLPGRLIRVSPDRRSTVAAEGIEFPNGLALIDDGATLIVAETFNQRLLAFDVSEDGSLSGRRIYADIARLAGADAQPDGLCAGVDGGVWVATLAAHTLLLVRDGDVIRSVDTGGGVPVACAVGSDGTLWATVADPGGRPFMDAVREKTISSSVWTFSPEEIDQGR